MPRLTAALTMLLLALAPAHPALAATRGGDIIAGPMVGHVTDRSARISMQLSIAKQVAIRCLPVEDGQQASAVTIDVEGPSPFICDTPPNNLKPNKTYRISVALDGE